MRNKDFFRVDSSDYVYKFFHNVSHWSIIFSIKSQSIETDNILLWDQRKSGLVYGVKCHFLALGQAQKCGGRGGGVKLVTGIPTLPSW